MPASIRHICPFAPRLPRLFVVALFMVMSGCQAPDGGSFGGSTSSAGALPRLDQICHHIVLTCNGTGGHDDVTLYARRQTASIENVSVTVETNSISDAWAKAVAKVESESTDLPFPNPAPHQWSALTRAIDRLHTRHWFVKIEKNGGWIVTAKRREADELFGHTDVFESASPDGLTEQINRHMDALEAR